MKTEEAYNTEVAKIILDDLVEVFNFENSSFAKDPIEQAFNCGAHQVIKLFINRIKTSQLKYLLEREEREKDGRLEE